MAVVVTAGAYLLLATFRAQEGLEWRVIAANLGFFGIAVAHIAAGASAAHPWQLAIAYALVAAFAAFDARSFRYTAVVVPAALSAMGAAILWAAGVEIETWAFPAVGIAVAIVVAGTLPLARPRPGGDGVAVDACARADAGPARWRVQGTPLGRGDCLQPECRAVPGWRVAFQWGAGTLPAGMDSARDRLIERQTLARFGGWLLFAAIGFANGAVGLTHFEGAWTFFAIAVVLCLAVVALRHWVTSLDEVLGPIALTAIVIAAASSWPHYGDAALMTGVFGVAATVAIGARFAEWWRVGSLASAAAAIFFALGEAGEVGRDLWQLPVVCGLLLVSLLWDAVRVRFEPSWLGVPVAAAGAWVSVAWWQGWAPEHSIRVLLALAAAIVLSERWWDRSVLLRGAACPYVLGLALAPCGLLGFEDAIPWDAGGPVQPRGRSVGGRGVADERQRGAALGLDADRPGERNVADRRTHPLDGRLRWPGHGGTGIREPCVWLARAKERGRSPSQAHSWRADGRSCRALEHSATCSCWRLFQRMQWPWLSAASQPGRRR